MWWVMMKKTKWRPTTKVNARPKVLSVFKQFRKNTLVLVGWAAVFPSFILIGSFEGFVPVYARTVGMSPLIIGALFSVSFVVGMATRIPLGALLDRTKHKVYLIAGGLASAAVMMAIIPFFTDPAILVVIFSLTAIARAMPNVGGNSLIGLGTTTDNRGAANGVTGICRNLGLAIGPMLLGVVASAQGFQIAFPVLATLGVGGAITVCLIGRNANRR
jgi:sugar phosphate permease